MGYGELSKRAVTIAKGIPLALKVFGSYFHSKNKDTWECALEKLKKYLDPNIHRVLRLSYDGLDDLEKKVFLDITFFFKDEDKGYVIRQLDAWRFHGACGVEALQEKALITISNDNRIQMHDLIQEMGWEIVRQESEDPGRRSRLRDPEEVSDVLKNYKGTEVEGLLLHVSQIGEVAFNVDSIKRMPKLRLLKFCSPLPVEVPMQIRYFVPEDFVDVNLKRIAADDVLEKMGEIIHEECNILGRRSHPRDIDRGTDIVDGMQILDTIIQMHILRFIKSNLPTEQDFENANQSGLGIPKQFLMLQKLYELPGTYQLQNYNECGGVLILEKNFMRVSTQQLMPHRNPDIESALSELMDLGAEVHTKFLHYLFMDGCSVSKEFSVFPNEVRPLNLRDTGMELLNSSTGNFISPECSDYDDGLQLLESTPPKQLPFLRSTYYHRLSNCRGQDSSGKTSNKLLVQVDGFRYSERVTFLGELSSELQNLLSPGLTCELDLALRIAAHRCTLNIKTQKSLTRTDPSSKCANTNRRPPTDQNVKIANTNRRPPTDQNANTNQRPPTDQTVKTANTIRHPPTDQNVKIANTNRRPATKWESMCEFFFESSNLLSRHQLLQKYSPPPKRGPTKWESMCEFFFESSNLLSRHQPLQKYSPPPKRGTVKTRSYVSMNIVRGIGYDIY